MLTMQRLTTDLISQASRIFLSLAYPGGEEAIPARRRLMLTLPPDQSMADQIAADPALRDCCQALPGKNGGVRAVLVRLGCTHYPHLKLKAHLCEDDAGGVWIFAVDTHDAFSKSSFMPPAGHPDASNWAQLQTANAALKVKIEAAWEDAGILTFNALLRRELESARPSGS
jgi:hypothetical protein